MKSIHEAILPGVMCRQNSFLTTTQVTHWAFCLRSRLFFSRVFRFQRTTMGHFMKAVKGRGEVILTKSKRKHFSLRKPYLRSSTYFCIVQGMHPILWELFKWSFVVRPRTRSLAAKDLGFRCQRKQKTFSLTHTQIASLLAELQNSRHIHRRGAYK